MKKEDKHKKIIIIVIIVLGAIILHATQAKYVITNQQQHATKSTERFYFQSEVLQEEKYELLDWDGTSTYIIENIDLKIIEDEIRYGDTNVQYEIEISANNASTILKINGQETSTGTITEKNIENIVIEAIPNVFNKAMVITLNVKSISPYQKEMQTIFEIIPSTDIEEYIPNLIDSAGKNDPVLYIQNNNKQKKFKIQYNNTKVLLDTSDNLQYEQIMTNDNISYVQITIEKNQVEAVRFIKNENYIERTLNLGEDIIVEVES